MSDDTFPPGMVKEIEAFLADDAKRPAGFDLYDGVFKTNLFFPLQRQAELRRMIQIARQYDFGWIKQVVRFGEEPRVLGPRVVAEIGADKGGGVYHWCKCLPSVKRMIACDIRGTPYNYVMQDAFKNVDMLWIPTGSRDHESLCHLANWLDTERIDVLFIDGDKSAFLKDFDAYLPLMNPRGVVFMHDINEPGPMRRAFETVKARGYRTEEIIDKSDYELSAVREAHGIQPANPHEAWLRHWAGRSCGVGVIYLGG